jgi:hypothetical protein
MYLSHPVELDRQSHLMASSRSVEFYAAGPLWLPLATCLSITAF